MPLDQLREGGLATCLQRHRLRMLEIRIHPYLQVMAVAMNVAALVANACGAALAMDEAARAAA